MVLRKNNLKRIMSLLLCFSYIFSTTSVFAQNNSIKESQKGPYHFEHVYEENGDIYKTKEDISSDFTQVNSEIYKENANGHFELIDTYITYIESEVDTVKISSYNASGNLITDLSIALPNKNEVVNYESNSYSSVYSVNLSSLSNYIYEGSSTGSNKLEKLTYSAILAAISVYVSAQVGLPAQVIIAAAGPVAEELVDLAIPTVYYRFYIYNKYWLKSDGSINYSAGPIYRKVTTECYSDSSRSDYICQFTTEDYVGPGESRYIY